MRFDIRTEFQHHNFREPMYIFYTFLFLFHLHRFNFLEDAWRIIRLYFYLA